MGNPVRPPVEAPVHAVAASIEATIRALAFTLETHCRTLESACTRAVRARGVSVLDAIAAQIRTSRDPITGTVEALRTLPRCAFTHVRGPRPRSSMFAGIVATVETPVDPIAGTIKPVLNPVALAIEAIVDPVACCFEAISKIVATRPARARRAGVVAVLDPRAPAIQPFIDAFTALIEALVDTITAVVRIGERGLKRKSADTE